MQILIYLATQQQDMENTLLGTWAHTFGPDYTQVIDSDPRWTIFDGTSERKTWFLLLRAPAPT